MADKPGTPNEKTQLAEFDKLWNYHDPAATEQAFRALTPEAEVSADPALHVELLSQIARAQGLQQHFDEARQTLTKAESLLEPEMAKAQVRVLLEQGRVENSSGHPAESVPFFKKALAAAQDAGLEYYAVDAAHMLGIVTKDAESIRWNERALVIAEAASDERARRWAQVLYNNLGWTYFDQKRYDESLRMFEKQLPFLDGHGNEHRMGVCLWSIAKLYRHVERVDEALKVQKGLLEHPGLQDDLSLGFTHEEIGECLLMLDRKEEAGPHFAKAWELLHEDPWLKRDEPDRLARMKQLSEGHEH